MEKSCITKLKETLYRHINNRKARWLLLLLPVFFCFFTVHRQKEKAEEYNLKAAFIYNFTRYIEWSTSSTDHEFIIGIIGSSQINDPLVEVVKTETVNNKKIIIRQFSKVEDISSCHILFIPKNSTLSLADILAKVEKGTLVVSEKSGYASKGTAINFVVVDNKLKFEANVNAINAAGLTASSQLLKLAIIIK
jgi:hypothetical protein